MYTNYEVTGDMEMDIDGARRPILDGRKCTWIVKCSGGGLKEASYHHEFYEVTSFVNADLTSSPSIVI